LEATEALIVDRVPATKLQLEVHESSADQQKKNCEHYAVIGNTLLLRPCPLPAHPQHVLQPCEALTLPAIRGMTLPELKVRFSYERLLRTQEQTDGAKA
jgi:hypothetical protein